MPCLTYFTLYNISSLTYIPYLGKQLATRLFTQRDKKILTYLFLMSSFRESQEISVSRLSESVRYIVTI